MISSLSWVQLRSLSHRPSVLVHFFELSAGKQHASCKLSCNSALQGTIIQYHVSHCQCVFFLVMASHPISFKYETFLIFLTGDLFLNVTVCEF